MAGPWEKYAPAPAEESGPWDKFTSHKGAPPAEPQVVQETHPDFTLADRYVVKNFSTDKQEAANYLQNKHPNLEVSLTDKGQIRARAKGTNEPYKVLDPDGFMANAAHFIPDNAYNIAAGIGTTAASAVAGLAGGAASGGVGAIPSAMAAGMAAGGGLEAARQALGRALGVNQSFDPLAIGLGAAGGAAGPLAFGTGATAGAVATKAAEAGIPEAALAATQRGLISRGATAAAPALQAIASKASGVPSSTIQGLRENLPEIRAMEKDPMALTGLVTGLAERIKNTLRGIKDQTWAPYEQHLAAAAPVDLAETQAVFLRRIATAEKIAKQDPTEANLGLVQELKDKFKGLFESTKTVQKEGTKAVDTGILDAAGKPVMRQVATTGEESAAHVATEIPAEAAEAKLKVLAELGQSNRPPAAVGNNLPVGTASADKVMMQTAKEAKHVLQDALEANLSPEGIASKKAYGQAANAERAAGEMLADPKIGAKSLRNLGTANNRTDQELLGQIDRQYGTDVLPTARKAAAFQTFASPSIMPLNSGGGSSLARSAALLAGGGAAGAGVDKLMGGEGHAGRYVGAGLGALLGSPAALRAYLTAAQFAPKAAPAAAAGTQSIWNMLRH